MNTRLSNSNNSKTITVRTDSNQNIYSVSKSVSVRTPSPPPPSTPPEIDSPILEVVPSSEHHPHHEPQTTVITRNPNDLKVSRLDYE